MELTIRRARPNDAATIGEYNARLAHETEDKELDPQVVARGVAKVLADPAKGFYLVAERAGKIVGQLMVTFEWSDWRDGWVWWIQSVYVRADARRSGVFKSLYAELLARAKSAGDVVRVRLYVERENTRAQATYLGLGLCDTGYLVFEAGEVR